MTLRVDQQALDHKYAASQYTGKSVDVYALDTGIHYNHTVFNGRAHYPGCDPIDKLEHETREGEDCNGHGTSITAIFLYQKPVEQIVRILLLSIY